MKNLSHIIRNFNRFELKYLITLQQAERLKSGLRTYLVPDEHGKNNGRYTVSSLYYDSPSFRCYWEKLDGLKVRRKLRIRRYETGGVFAEETPVFVEIKQRGVVLISGPVENMNGALDYLGQFNISGGFLVAAGSAGMAQAPSGSSAQYSLLVNFDGTARSDTLAHIQTSGGEQVLTFAPAKQYQSLVFSYSELELGSTYDLYLRGSSDGEVSDGLYQGGSYASGTKVTSFTVSDIVTWLGARRR